MVEGYPVRQEREPRISDGLDFYKLTMGQIAFEQFAGTEVTFTFKNRDCKHPMSEFVTAQSLGLRLEKIRSQGFSAEEIAYLAGIQAQDGSARFDEPYLNYLASIELPPVSVSMNQETQDIDIVSRGDWAAVSLWETIVMSEANEEYYVRQAEAQGIDVSQLMANGDQILSEKIVRLKSRPDIKFADFGTRRRYSAAWHDHVVGRLANELPDNFVGTSNPWFAYKYGVKPIGTYAHEEDMVQAALAEEQGEDPLEAHSAMMDSWFKRYGEDLSIALTDTFTSDFFFASFTEEQAHSWRGLRQDSGDPVDFGERAIQFYERMGIDPLQKTIVFSDGLDLDMIIKLADHFNGRVNLLYGWGTTLMNDLGLRANNIVMKATNANGIDTVKLSDNPSKHTGPEQQVQRYIDNVNRHLARACLQKVAP